MLERLELGVCYYPEHWPESIWEEDLIRMKECGIDTVRVGEFAWALFEPEEGRFDFALFDRFLDLARRQGMRVILGTPTATPPIWLTEKYPEALNARVDGTLYHHGLRRHYNYNSEKYRELCARIVREMGDHFGHHPAVIGWQIDNELNCETSEFHSEADQRAFREYMKRRFGTLENLNDKMGGAVWSQIYTDWSQLHLRRPTIHDQYNPHLLLEEKRFVSESAVSFCRMQCEILRPRIGGAFITTNGIFGDLDYSRLVGGDLDFLCYDSYPNFGLDMYQEPEKQEKYPDRKWGRNLSVTRAWSPRFGIMEEQSGANGWTGRMEAPMPRPGQMRLWTMQSVAHGANFISYFRWRTAPFGTEIYWHGLNDYDNLENRRLAELRTIRDDFAKLAGVADAPYWARVAYLLNCDNEWDAESDRWLGRLNKLSFGGMYRAAQRLHEPMDYLYLSERTRASDLAKYELLIYPHPAILEDETAAKLEEYVRGGGQLIFCARTGYKDRWGRCPMRPMGFRAAELCGIRISDYSFVGPHDEPGMADMDGAALPMPLFNDVLDVKAEDACVEAVYSANYYAGKPAVVSRALGKGRVWYYGAALSEEAGAAMLKRLGFGEPHGDAIELPECCELALRGKYLFVLNYARAEASIRLKVPMRDLLSGETLEGHATLPPFGVRVFWQGEDE